MSVVAMIGGAGSIPALTGKPRCVCGATSRCGVYPRAYGETSDHENILKGTSGLSPRLRGNLVDANHGAGSVGSIPALTGKPAGAGESTRTVGVYPRAYGETETEEAAKRYLAGLSPRLRGNPG